MTLRVGILGGGQLARLMAIQGAHLGYQMVILSEHPDDPAAQVTRHWIEGSTNVATVEAMLPHVDLITFESEFVSSLVLDRLEELEFPTFPNPRNMRQLANRLTQKQALVDYEILTSPFYEITDPSEIVPETVLKLTQGGYDGKGTFVVNHHNTEEAQAFFTKAQSRVMAEEWVEFERELAISVARDRAGHIGFTPLVQSIQKDNRCDRVFGPIHHPHIEQFKKQVERFVQEIDYHGLLTFELFDSPHGLMVNELAPRVHNSGHFSTEGLSVDQFTLHLLAITQKKLPVIELNAPGFAMINLIGQSRRKPQFVAPAYGKLYWYGKSENRPGRKMGHINALASSPQEALVKAMKTAEEIKL